MLLKSIIRSLCALSFGAAALALFAAPGHAWDEITIDNETHRDNPSLVQGTYTDWTYNEHGWDTNPWPYVWNNFSQFTSQWEGTQDRQGVAVWRVQIPKTGWYSLKAYYKETHNRTSAAQYYLYVNKTLPDIDSYKGTDKGDFVSHLEFDQYGERVYEHTFAEIGTFCMKAGEVSVLVLDNRLGEAVRSASADAATWTYMGEEFNSEKCADAPPPLPIVLPPINHLLLKNK